MQDAENEDRLNKRSDSFLGRKSKIQEVKLKTYQRTYQEELLHHDLSNPKRTVKYSKDKYPRAVISSPVSDRKITLPSTLFTSYPKDHSKVKMRF